MRKGFSIVTTNTSQRGIIRLTMRNLPGTGDYTPWLFDKNCEYLDNVMENSRNNVTIICNGYSWIMFYRDNSLVQDTVQNTVQDNSRDDGRVQETGIFLDKAIEFATKKRIETHQTFVMGNAKALAQALAHPQLESIHQTVIVSPELEEKIIQKEKSDSNVKSIEHFPYINHNNFNITVIKEEEDTCKITGIKVLLQHQLLTKKLKD